ncbi:helix-turn-helix domain-containing protein [Rhodococcus sp. SGAir0479]|uniref:helix-turn-helix domain-containing protein n=1 Tax=Rhodococcus sp. SGAir0479 TaxID=2567884 RepID=UPI0010CD3669|nr:helix-turn-helix transcriptional regulator [Rhodococcus sp. SGAir0479]QCQ90759.1 XRE family transcriptional regulator [Rhodococcus sp. SGAir0479]
MALLLREAIGDSLRRTRVSQSRTLREVSNSARVSLGYLSEIERGRKEASSELLAAICDALEVPLSEVLVDVSETMAVGAAPSVDGRRADDRVAAGSDAQVMNGRIAQETRVVIPAPPARTLAAA